MLVLSRRPGEQICIGKNILVRIVSIRGTNVRIGIEAPVEVPVDRQELRERKAIAALPRSGLDLHFESQSRKE
jgi:carbon storage regulator